MYDQTVDDEVDGGALGVGVQLVDVPDDIGAAIGDAISEQAASFVVTPLFYGGRHDAALIPDAPIAVSDLSLTADQWIRHVVMSLASWPDLALRHADQAARALVREQLEYARHLSLSAVVLPAPPALVADTGAFVQYASALTEFALAYPTLQFWVRLPLAPGAWCTWNALGELCGDARPALYPFLELVADSAAMPEPELQRWRAETVPAIAALADVPLTAALRSFLECLYAQDVRVVVAAAAAPTMLDRLQAVWTDRAATCAATRFAAAYRDVLQAPLQPLADNLASQTYEVFEQDPVKYARYEDAIVAALRARFAEHRARAVSTVVMVVGAGRGPLVHAVLRAADRADDHPVRVFAIEKNANACNTLRHLARESWAGRVEVVQHDMRTWRAPCLADILVSELLGSFGDNELSPECLDGAQRFLGACGVSIPCRYASYLAPIAAPRLWRAIEAAGALETVHVVHLQSYFQVADAQRCFTFEHPRSIAKAAGNDPNERAARLRFESVIDDCVVHAFAGYFEATLFEGGERDDDIRISINPATFSEGMFSWFPAVLPLRAPVRLARDEPLTIHINRRVRAPTGVWYDWTIETTRGFTPVHNPNGRAYAIGL